jgi:hypothetical protein
LLLSDFFASLLCPILTPKMRVLANSVMLNDDRFDLLSLELINQYAVQFVVFVSLELQGVFGLGNLISERN